MRFRPSAKIPGPGQAKGRVPPGGAWVALEKIHGAQLVLGVAGAQVRFGKRKEWLADGEPFFGWQLLRAGLGEAARALAAEVRSALL